MMFVIIVMVGGVFCDCVDCFTNEMSFSS